MSGKYNDFHYGVEKAELSSKSSLWDVTKMSKLHPRYNKATEERVFGVKMGAEEVLYTKSQAHTIKLGELLEITGTKQREL